MDRSDAIMLWLAAGGLLLFVTIAMVISFLSTG